MNLHTKLLIAFLFFFSELPAQNNFYAVNDIPEALLSGADVVKRDETITLQINHDSEVIVKKKYAYTILNTEGEHAAHFYEFYDELREIRSIEGRLFDASGKEVRKLKAKEIQDLSGVSGADLMTDVRVKSHNFHAVQYPYTVEYAFELRYKSTFFLPSWVPRDAENVSVQQSSVSVIIPADYVLRYKALHLSVSPAERTEKNKKTLTWSVQNLEAVTDEFASPDWYEFNPVVLFAPDEFSLQGYKGRMNSWNELALFTHSLKKDRDLLPEPVRQQVKALVGTLPEKKEKVRVLYEYLQSNTRYISVQLGVGGWVPFDAPYVSKNAYGDCKALSNYMVALLKEAGITAFYSLVKAGEGASEIVTDFPSQQFNHAIVCVPMEKDSIWLECTSQVMPMGYLGSFTDNRLALLVGEHGGKLVRTPSYRLEHNRQIRTINAELNASGDLSAVIKTSYLARQQDDLHSLITQKSKDELKQYLQKSLPLPTYEVNKFDYDIKKGVLPSITETIGLSVLLYATVTGKRMFITPNLISKDGRKLASQKSRTQPIDIDMPYWDTDTVEIILPQGYKLESGGGSKEYTSVFGHYQSSAEVKNGRLIYCRNFRRFSGKFSEDHFEELAKFLSEIYASDRSRLVLVKE